MVASPRRPHLLTRGVTPLLVSLLLAACSRRPVVTRPHDDVAPLARRATTMAPATGVASLGLAAGAAEPGPRDGRRGTTVAAGDVDLRAARDVVACKAETPQGRTLVLDPRDATTNCAIALSGAVRDALVAAAFPGGHAACAHLPCDEPSEQAGSTAVSTLDHASGIRGAFTAPGHDQIAWALVAQADGLPLAFALTTMLVTEGDTIVARAEPEALSHGTFALAKALDADGDGADDLVTHTSTTWMGEGRVDAALVGVRAGKLVELEAFDDVLVEHMGLGAESEADTATRLFFVSASAAGPATLETEPFLRACHPANAPLVRPTAKLCTGGAADWRRASPPKKAPASWAPAAGTGTSVVPSAPAAPPAPAAPAAPNAASPLPR